MRNYTTQMDAARKGIVTPEIEAVAKKEHMTSEALMKLVAEGKVAICANRNHTCLNPEGVGSMLRTKINVNLGVSRDCKDYDIEMQKVMSAVNLGAEAIMDLSSHGNTQPFCGGIFIYCRHIQGHSSHSSSDGYSTKNGEGIALPTQETYASFLMTSWPL